MAIELKVPSFGESITDVIIGEWFKSPGDHVAEDDPVVSIESDKVTAELPAPVNGVVTEVLKAQGEEAVVGEVIGYMEAGDPAAPGDVPKDEPAAEKAEAAPSPAKPSPTPEPATKPAAGPRVMPAARRALAEAELDPGEVRATGPGGRLLKEDVLRHVEAKADVVAPSPDFRDAPVASQRQEELVKMTPLRARIAERLVQAQRDAALLTTFNEIDMSRVMGLRREFKDAFAERHGVKLGFMSFFVKAAIEALKEFPELNGEIRDDSIVYRNYFDIGVAIGGGRGLVVPVIRSAERLSFAEIESTIGDFAERAQTGKLKLEELQNGTFTISNGGVYGSLLSTPIVNPPQSGVLGLHRIQERPVVVDGEVVVRPMMYVALTYDHRIVDGREGVAFLLRVKECIENPSRILLEI